VTQFDRQIRTEIITGSTRTIIEGGRDALRMSFEAVLTESTTANSGKVTIWNLSNSTARLFEKDDAEIAIFAGYRLAGGPVQVFRGSLAADGFRDDRSTETRISAATLRDGGTALRDVVISLNVAGSTTSDAILRRLAGELGASIGTFSPGRSRTYRRGFSHFGPARRALRTLARDSASVVSITDGRMTVYPRNGERRSTGFRISSRSTLITAKSTKEGVEVVSTLLPSMRPGDRFLLDDEALGGDYIAAKVRHSGDTESGSPDFLTTITARRT